MVIYLQGTREPLKGSELESAELSLRLSKVNLVGRMDWRFLEGALD